MFLRIAGAHRAEQSGIKGVKIPFDPNINILIPRSFNAFHVPNESLIASFSCQHNKYPSDILYREELFIS